MLFIEYLSYPFTLGHKHDTICSTPSLSSGYSPSPELQLLVRAFSYATGCTCDSPKKLALYVAPSPLLPQINKHLNNAFEP